MQKYKNPNENNDINNRIKLKGHKTHGERPQNAMQKGTKRGAKGGLMQPPVTQVIASGGTGPGHKT